MGADERLSQTLGGAQRTLWKLFNLDHHHEGPVIRVRSSPAFYCNKETPGDQVIYKEKKPTTYLDLSSGGPGGWY